MTNATQTNRATEILMDLHQPLFEHVLINASMSEKRWSHRVKTFESLGLLDFHTASTLKPRPVFDQFVEDENGERIYVFSEKQLEVPNWQHRLVRKLRAPRPSQLTRHRLPLHRDQVNDDKYRQDIAKVLAYKWALNLELGHMDIAFMRLMDVVALEHLLDTFRLSDISAKNINSFLLHRLVNQLFDKSEKLEARFNSMKEKIALVQEQAVKDMQLRCAEILAESRLASDAILAETQAQYDAAIAANRKREADDAALYAKTLAERALRDDEDPEESFRRAVGKRLARQKAARKRLAQRKRRHPTGFVFWAASRLALVGVPLFLAFHLKMGSSGVTLVELISRLLN